MKINPIAAATALSRYERVVGQKVAVLPGEPARDRVEISDRAQLYGSLVTAAREIDIPASDKIHGLINRLASGTYEVDIDRLAGKMMAGLEEL